MKKLIGLVLLAFGVTLAVIIGQRMSTDAMAVVIGVAVGVAASVPTSLLLVALLRRERAIWRQEPPPQTALPPAPPANVIVLDPAQLWGQKGGQAPYVPLPPIDYAQGAGVHRLRVVGSEDEWTTNEW